MKAINGGTKAVCLIGDPVEHSFSPIIHNYGFKNLNINAIYINHRVENSNLKSAMEGIKALGYLGCNVTYPHKIEVMKFLDDLSQEAKLIGAVNTIRNDNGKLTGYNTDGLGFVTGLLRKGINLNGKKICILGAGGAAKSIAVALAIHFDCIITICNRSMEKAMEIIDTINNIQETPSSQHHYITSDEIDTYSMDVLINCTPVGMVPNIDNIPYEDKIIFHKDLIVSDIIYQPFETALLKKAKLANCTIHHGIDMLIDQGILAFEIWTGEKLDFEEIKELLVERIYGE
ncbi:MAG: shikimate dehydrogenase [Clostridiaceae bacterium]|nr:shikimate dehydrogenase [Clostridiaceae bacterium]